MRDNKAVKTKNYLKRLRKTPYSRRKGMSEQDTGANGDIVKDFQSTGRTGRRNAMADVLGAHKNVSTSDLPLQLEKLSTNDLSLPGCSSSPNQNNCINNNENESSLSTAAVVTTKTTSSS